MLSSRLRRTPWNPRDRASWSFRQESSWRGTPRRGGTARTGRPEEHAGFHQHGGVHDHAFGIDDEQAAQSNTGFFVENVVSRGDLLLEIGNEGIGDVAKAALVAWGLNPSEVAELAVNGDAQHFSVLAGEIGVAIAEGSDFSRADEGEVEGIEEQHHILAAVLGEADLLELLVHYSGGCEIRGLLAHAQATVSGHDEGARVEQRKRGG